MTTTRLYQSSDSGAPVISGSTTGSLVAALKTCLVGAGGIAYGSTPSAGWTEEYSGTNISVLRNSTAAGGTGAYFRIEDTATTNQRAATCIAYASMSDVNTGTDATASKDFLRAPDSGTGTTTWFIVADEITAYICLTQGSNCVMGMFGDIDSFSSGDAYRYFVASAGTAMFGEWFDPQSVGIGTTGATDRGFSMPKDYTGIGSASPHFLLSIHQTSNYVAPGGSLYPARPAPNSADEAAMPAIITRGSVFRGRLRGIFYPLSNISGLSFGAVKSGDGFGGVGSVCKLASLHNTGYAARRGGFWIETALPW